MIAGLRSCIPVNCQECAIAILLFNMPSFTGAIMGGDLRATKVVQLECEIECALAAEGSDSLYFGLSSGEVATMSAPYRNVRQCEKVHSAAVSVLIQVSKSRFLSGDFNGGLFAWTPEIKGRVKFPGHERLVSAGGSFDGVTGVTGDSGGTLIVWNFEMVRQMSKHSLSDDSYLCVCRFGLKPGELLLCQSLGPLRIVKLDTLADLQKNNNARVRHLCISPDRKFLIGTRSQVGVA